MFLVDPEGNLRFDSEWTRDAYARVPAPRERAWRWVLARDRGSGYVQLVLATSPELLAAHPRLDVRSFVDRALAVAALRALGRPPIDRAGT